MRLSRYVMSWLLLPFLCHASLRDPTTVLHSDWIDTKVAPSENFYAYANGTWQGTHPIPAQYSSWGTFSILWEKTQKEIHQLIEEAGRDKAAKPGSIAQKVGDFYASGMDEKGIERQGVAPLLPEFARIDAIHSLQSLQEVIAYLHTIAVNAGFTFGSMQDYAHSDEMIGAAMQGGLGLPDRDYYLKKDKKFQAIRSAYLDHIASMFALMGRPSASRKKDANTVMRMETLLAKASMSPIEQRDPHAIYHIMTLRELQEQTPHFSWASYLRQMGQPSLKSINLGMPLFFKAWDDLLVHTSLDDWKVYLRWQLLDAYAPYLSKPFVAENFKMNSVLSGTKTELPRWQRVVSTENGALGFAIGELYVKRYFSPKAKRAVLEIVDNIRKALHDDLQSLSWMSPVTRKAALTKLDLMGERVGYPDKWWDYSTLVIDRGPYVLNVKRANAFLVKRDLDKIGKPIDKTEWAMSPQTVNAYYDPSMNNINLPAGILQPPFFDETAPAAVNYGAIGFVIGHEMTHGFDDQGAQFDGHGNLHNWWSAQDLKKFQEATSCIEKQFSSYKVNGDLSVQGKLVMGEATADLGGLTLAYRAFLSSPQYKTAKNREGFTPAQQFFLSAAHVWASNTRPEQMRNLVMTDPHPPMMYRVNGSFANMPEFEAAFSIPKESLMVNKNRCIVW